MSAKDQFTKMLDQLMGQNRDGSDGSREKVFTDKDVCRPFLLGICISDLFVNTRAELPDCTKLHSLGLKVKYEQCCESRDYHYEEEVLAFLNNFIRDNERKIEVAKSRLHHTQDAPDNEERLDKIHELAVQIGEKVAKAEILGAEGNVDESLALMAEVEEVKGQKRALEDEYHGAIPRHAVQQQKLRACEVCGAFLSMYDNDRRLADHFGGKLHIGFVTIREKLKFLEDAIKAKEEKRVKEREAYLKEREEYEKEREKKRSGSHDRDKSRDSTERRQSHSKERDRDRRRSRSRDRDQDKRRSYSRERGRDRRRSRSRDRDRRRDRDDRDERRRRSRADSGDRRRNRDHSREYNGRHRDRSRSR